MRLLKTQLRSVPRQGWTLMEMMISVGVGTLLLASVGAVYVFMGRTLDATINYEELDRQSRNALDTMSIDIRQCVGVTGYATNSPSFTDPAPSPLALSPAPPHPPHPTSAPPT